VRARAVHDGARADISTISPSRTTSPSVARPLSSGYAPVISRSLRLHSRNEPEATSASALTPSHLTSKAHAGAAGSRPGAGAGVASMGSTGPSCPGEVAEHRTRGTDMRAIWKGAVAFGLVNVPVRLYSATRENEVRLHQVHQEDGGRIRYRKVCSLDGETV